MKELAVTGKNLLSGLDQSVKFVSGKFANIVGRTTFYALRTWRPDGL